MSRLLLTLALLACSITSTFGSEPTKPIPSSLKPEKGISADPHDWPMYNRDVVGTRHNPAEKMLRTDNIHQLVEKWRFPPRDSTERIGVVHATSVVNGHVYFGTETTPTVYKLTPDGKVKWSFPPRGDAKAEGPRTKDLPAGLPISGFLNAPLVTDDSVYIGDLTGTLYALDRASGKLRWRVNTRSKPFPAAHSNNCIFSSPILADGLIIVGGGAFEHVAAANPFNKGCTGRGLVFALEPASGKVVWVYYVGPEARDFDAPVTITHAWGKHVYQRGPSTSSVWCTPSYDAETKMLFFGTDCHNSPRQPTKDDPKLYTKHSCACIAVDVKTGKEKWVTQVNPGDVWNFAQPAYDPKTGLYKDQSIGDTPKIYWILIGGRWRKVVGFGCKNGAYYVLDAETGELLFHTPLYDGPPVHPPPVPPKLNPRTLALPSCIGGLQTGCATDGKAVYTNGIDIMRMGTNPDARLRFFPPTGGRVVSISLDTTKENWRHERPKVATVGGTKEAPAFTDVGDPVASGIALANGMAFFTTIVSNKLVIVDTSTGKLLREIDLNEPIWCGPVVSRGRVYVGTGNLLFAPNNAQEDYIPKSPFGAIISFGLPGEDEVDRMRLGKE